LHFGRFGRNGAATNGIGQGVQGTNVVSFAITVTNGAVEKEYEKLQAEDGAAEAEVARWIAENNEKAKGAGVSGGGVGAPRSRAAGAAPQGPTMTS